MPDDTSTYTSFLGTGWSFPPRFSDTSGEVLMTSDEEDIHASLKILFGTEIGERFLNPKYGLEMRQLLSTQARPDVADLLRDRGWSADEQSAREVAARYGRDLSDPFAATGSATRSADTEPPWLDTGFVTGAICYQAARDARPSA